MKLGMFLSSAALGILRAYNYELFTARWFLIHSIIAFVHFIIDSGAS